tara:strand:- start:1551 stop:2420 length:870 start_codon:yes stop_codon:yes gene_type:complete
MSIKENLNSYSIPQLRVLVREHNKKVNISIKNELKEVRGRMKEKRLIKIVGDKDKNSIIEKMMKHKDHFKDVPKKKELSEDEQNEYIDNVINPLYTKIVKEYMADGDLDELEDGVSELYKLSKSKGLEIFQSKKKMVKDLIKEAEEDKKKEEEDKKNNKPPRPKNPPLFIYKNGKLRLISLLEKKKASRPAKPTRDAVKKIKKNVPFVPKPKVDYRQQVIDKYDLKIGSRIKLGDSQGDEVAVVKELGANKMRVSTEIGNIILTLKYNRIEIEKMIKKKMKSKILKIKK